MEMGTWNNLNCGKNVFKLTVEKQVIFVASDICLPIAT